MANEVDPEVGRKARRHLAILYTVMIVFILLPFVLWWLRSL